MLPVVASTNTFSFQTPLVNTPLPGNAVVRVPFDTVAPSTSSDQLRNNTQGNGAANPTSQAQAAAQAVAPPSAEEGGSQFIAQLQRNVANALSTGVQATFVAQLAAQELTPEARGILVQYEKLVANGNVKYKPSNAAKPEAAPAGVFGRLLESQQQQPPQVALAQAASLSVQVAVDAVEAAPVAPARPQDDDASEPESAEAASSETPAAGLDVRALNAYASSAQRVASFTRSSTPVEGAGASGELA